MSTKRNFPKDDATMSTDAIQRQFQQSVASEVTLAPEGADRFRVFIPFGFDDGDEFAIVLKREGDGWLLSDEAHTYMHLSYDIDLDDLRKGQRARIISNALNMFGINDRDGELVIPVQDEQYGDALFSFVQGLARIANVTQLSRRIVRSTFLEDFRLLMAKITSDVPRHFEWYDEERDQDGKYTVDCRVDTATAPLFIQALANERSTRDATIAFLKFAQWNIPFEPVGVFDDRSAISPSVLARFDDVCPTQFPSVVHHEKIADYIRGRVSA